MHLTSGFCFLLLSFDCFSNVIYKVVKVASAKRGGVRNPQLVVEFHSTFSLLKVFGTPPGEDC